MQVLTGAEGMTPTSCCFRPGVPGMVSSLGRDALVLDLLPGSSALVLRLLSKEMNALVATSSAVVSSWLMSATFRTDSAPWKRLSVVTCAWPMPGEHHTSPGTNGLASVSAAGSGAVLCAGHQSCSCRHQHGIMTCNLNK